MKKKVLITPAHYLLDEASVSEFYLASQVIQHLALLDDQVEYYVLCGFCAQKDKYPKNVFFREMSSKYEQQLNVYYRIRFYLWLLWESIRLSFQHKFEVVWHFLPNGRFSFNLFVFFQLDKLFAIKHRVLGRITTQYRVETFKDGLSLQQKEVKTFRENILLYRLLSTILGLFTTYYFSLFDQFVFYEENSLKWWTEKYIRNKSAEQYHIIPVGIDLAKFKPKEDKDYNLDRKLRILFVGHLIERKRVDLVIKVCHLLQTRGVNLHLDILGDGGLRKDLENLVKDLNLQSVVDFRGRLPKDQVIEFYQNSHYCFLFSEAEGFSHTILESWATKTFFVGSNIPSNRSIVTSETGLLVDVTDESNLEIVVDKILESKNNYRQVVERAYEQIANYSWPCIAQKYYQVLFKSPLAKDSN